MRIRERQPRVKRVIETKIVYKCITVGPAPTRTFLFKHKYIRWSGCRKFEHVFISDNYVGAYSDKSEADAERDRLQSLEDASHENN